MIRDYYKITYRDKNFNYEKPFLFKVYDISLLDIQIDKYLSQGYYDIKVYHIVETEELVKEIN